MLALAVLIGGGAGGFAFYRARAAKKVHGHHAVALLPFVDATHAQQLDFASAGLPNLLGLELHGMPDVKVIGYYQLLSNVRAAESPPAEWVAAAKKLGADVLVHGQLTPDPSGVRVTIRVEEADGQVLATVERAARVEQVPEIVRGSAPEVARAVAVRGWLSNTDNSPKKEPASRLARMISSPRAGNTISMIPSSTM